MPPRGRPRSRGQPAPARKVARQPERVLRGPSHTPDISAPTTPTRSLSLASLSNSGDSESVSGSDTPPPPPPVLVSPTKKRTKHGPLKLSQLSDLEAWDFSDTEIIGECLSDIL
jgi:hypothetical protein